MARGCNSDEADHDLKPWMPLPDCERIYWAPEEPLTAKENRISRELAAVSHGNLDQPCLNWNSVWTIVTRSSKIRYRPSGSVRSSCD